ncbi:TlyA family RNA methyltransferase [Cellulomonas shaoxiangyii]|uniref:TlyA family RNA methyltransferase n=1 Tax=Cellulomonas shaoxiangyii TaxID=2566013 RepID=A0A4P7SIG9_9CELL|nr:TlyA family RNA methyltransferase [Cellulomonas shaoxiangyii]QCB93840.1 TlyA family RNA methyltransferase [Cellulomonas shaoxiangyii]TGY84466.1 TlyA family RNA methyltransferase [Cellulomonas shaoxiangyii]
MSPTVTARLDTELVRRGLARSRTQAARLVADGRVRVDGVPAARAATSVDAAQDVAVHADPADPGWASRAAHKLADALDAWPDLEVRGAVCLDAGASTGGFTDVLLRRGAAHVVAVDVGHDQIVGRLREDARVEVREGVNVRDLRASDVAPAPTVVVGDLSFISLRLVLAPLLAVAAPGADLVLLVKPQFEVGRERLGAHGVVRDPALWRAALLDVCATATDLGARVVDVRPSTLPGTHGNVEFVLRLAAPGRERHEDVDVAATVDTAVAAATALGATVPGHARPGAAR